MANARLDKNGFALEAGFIKIFYYDGITKEYLGEKEEYVSKGVSISANSTIVNPLREKKGYAVIMDGDQWKYIEDFRGVVAYDKETRLEQTISSLGAFPDNLTKLPPTSQFDEWDGEKWVKNIESEKEFYTMGIKAEITSRLQYATSVIDTLKDLIELDQATEEDEEKLKNWKLYRISLLKFDTNNYIDVEYPVQPKL